MNRSSHSKILSLFTLGLLAAWIVVFAAASASALTSDPDACDSQMDEFRTVSAEVVAPSLGDTELETAFRTVPSDGIWTSVFCADAGSSHARAFSISSSYSPLSLLLVATQATSTSL